MYKVWAFSCFSGLHEWWLSGKKIKNKNPPINAEDLSSIPGSGGSPREGNGIQYSCLKNPWTEEPDGL